jgi:hypothetical protein
MSVRLAWLKPVGRLVPDDLELIPSAPSRHSISLPALFLAVDLSSFGLLYGTTLSMNQACVIAQAAFLTDTHA